MGLSYSTTSPPPPPPSTESLDEVIILVVKNLLCHTCILSGDTRGINWRFRNLGVEKMFFTVVFDVLVPESVWEFYFSAF